MGQQSRAAATHHRPLLAWTSYAGPSHPVLGPCSSGSPSSWPGTAWLCRAPQPAHRTWPPPGLSARPRSWRDSCEQQGKGPALSPVAEASFRIGHVLPSCAGLRKMTIWEERGQAVSERELRIRAHGNRSEKGYSCAPHCEGVTPCAGTTPASGPPLSCSAHGSPCVPVCPGRCEEGR